MTKRSILADIGSFFGDIGRARRAVNAYERLSALSDVQLAARGLSRGDLPATAFERAFGK